MRIVGITSLYLPTKPDRESLLHAVAHAYAVPEEDVSIGGYSSAPALYPPRRRVYLNLWHDAYEGDLRVAFDQEVDEALVADIDATMQRLAEALGMAVVTNDSDAAPAFIHLPDGTTQRRYVDELDDGGLLLPPDLRARVAAEQSSRAA